MGLDSLDFYPKSEVLCRPGRKSRGVKSITTYRWSCTLNLSLAIRSFQFFIFFDGEKIKSYAAYVISKPTPEFELILYDMTLVSLRVTI